jgi:hypothetical protein
MAATQGKQSAVCSMQLLHHQVCLVLQVLWLPFACRIAWWHDVDIIHIAMQWLPFMVSGSISNTFACGAVRASDESS